MADGVLKPRAQGHAAVSTVIAAVAARLSLTEMATIEFDKLKTPVPRMSERRKIPATKYWVTSPIISSIPTLLSVAFETMSIRLMRNDSLCSL